MQIVGFPMRRLICLLLNIVRTHTKQIDSAYMQLEDSLTDFSERTRSLLDRGPCYLIHQNSMYPTWWLLDIDKSQLISSIIGVLGNGAGKKPPKPSCVMHSRPEFGTYMLNLYGLIKQGI